MMADDINFETLRELLTFGITVDGMAQNNHDFYLHLRSSLSEENKATHQPTFEQAAVHCLSYMLNQVETKWVKVSGAADALADGQYSAAERFIESLNIPQIKQHNFRRFLLLHLIKNSEQDARFAQEQSVKFLGELLDDDF